MRVIVPATTKSVRLWSSGTRAFIEVDADDLKDKPLDGVEFATLRTEKPRVPARSARLAIPLTALLLGTLFVTGVIVGPSLFRSSDYSDRTPPVAAKWDRPYARAIESSPHLVPPSIPEAPPILDAPPHEVAPTKAAPSPNAAFGLN